jgi:hypothetical protein
MNRGVWLLCTDEFIHSSMAVQYFLDPGRLFSLVIVHTDSRTPLTGDEPVARPLPTQENTNIE